MKKKKMGILIAAVFVVLILLFKGGSGKNIVGMWTQPLDGGTQIKCKGKTYTVYTNGIFDELYFYKDGQVDYGDIIKGSYSVEKDTLSIQRPYSGITEYKILEMKNKQMILYDEYHEVCYVYQRN